MRRECADPAYEQPALCWRASRLQALIGDAVL